MPSFALPEPVLSYLELHLGPLLKADRLSGGHQHSWLLKTQTELLVLRLNQHQPCYGLDYQREREVLQQLNLVPWAIKLHPLSNSSHFLLYYYQQGEVVSHNQWRQPVLWQQLLMILQQLPKAGKGLPHFDMLGYLTHYVCDVTNAQAQGWRQRALRWIEQQNWPSATAFNHHDLHLENLLVTPQQKLLVLDWEYAATSMLGWDAASVSVRCPVNIEQRQQLLKLSDLGLEQFALLEKGVTLLDLAWYWQYQAEQPLLMPRSLAWLESIKV
ncbi:phosphotransferase [Agarivorans sp. TSD2052]|uniref:phosphotransferase family protein n=1 Tax=Agarivorans sp. TSD2052 TaxID=2937286 RepID=UPI00200BF64A|nr:phosphotransferase [Agarivorans sp. TSD2052]UPW17639.1 phosphotransferase [Agarivorans sp. TSD2052]